MPDTPDSDSLFGLSGKVACVTGASSGLGRRSALALAVAGAKVVGIARRREQLEGLCGEIGESSAAVVHDLGRQTEHDKLAAKIAEPFGDPDIVVHAAGVNLRQPAEEITQASWDATLDLNLGVPFFLSRQLVPAMTAKGWGRIINFASLQSYRAFPNGIPYGASKGGIAQLTRAMAQAWSGQGIMVNAIGPGFFHTELTAAVFADPGRAARNAEQTCVNRNGELEDIDGPLLFLASRASDYVTGQVLMVDGGFTAK